MSRVAAAQLSRAPRRGGSRGQIPAHTGRPGVRRPNTAGSGERGGHDDGGCSGYDEEFLAVPVARCRGPTAQRALVDLPYPRFSVLLDTRGAWRRSRPSTSTAHVCRTSPAPATGISIRGSPRQQAGPALYADNDLDRGHLVRRRDPGGVRWPRRAPPPRRPSCTRTPLRRQPCSISRRICGSGSRTMCSRTRTQPTSGCRSSPARCWTRRIRCTAESVSLGASGRWPPGPRPTRGATALAAGFLLDQSALIDLDDTALAVAPLGAFRTFQIPISDIAALRTRSRTAGRGRCAADAAVRRTVERLAGPSASAVGTSPLLEDLGLSYSPASPPSRWPNERPSPR